MSKRLPYLPRTELSDFWKEFLDLLYGSDSWSWDFNVDFFPLQNEIAGTLLCLMVVGVAHINRMFVVLQKTNNVFVKMPFIWGAIFGR